jgi:hypothetical protein
MTEVPNRCPRLPWTGSVATGFPDVSSWRPCYQTRYHFLQKATRNRTDQGPTAWTMPLQYKEHHETRGRSANATVSFGDDSGWLRWTGHPRGQDMWLLYRAGGRRGKKFLSCVAEPEHPGY